MVDIESVIQSLRRKVKIMDPTMHLNERYLHHVFSGLVQAEEQMSFDKCCRLHPEWATYIEDLEERHFGRYSKDENGFERSCIKGRSGFLDFAYGTINKPSIGIEFKFSRSPISEKAMAFDYLKLLDRCNPFKEAYYVVVYIGQKHNEEFIRNRHQDMLARVKRENDTDSSRNIHVYVDFV